jgi:ribosomal protein S18 acetylase RimI-like enzyme
VSAQNLQIRDLQPDDYDSLVELWDSVGLPIKSKGRDSREDIERQIDLSCTIYRVAVMDDRLVGAVLGSHDGRKGWINRLAVHPEFTRKGIAKALVDEVERRLSDLGIGIVAALVEDRNTLSLEVFQKLGYEDFPGIHYVTKREHSDI